VESIVGISVDITKRKKAEKQLKEALNKLRGILAASTRVGIISTDQNGMISSFNRGAEYLLGYSAEEVIDMDSPLTFYLKQKLKKTESALDNSKLTAAKRTEIIRRFIKQTKFQTKEWVLERKDGSFFPAQLTITEIVNDDGELNGYLGIVSDISELKRRENELKHLLEINKEQNERLLNFAHIVSHNLKGHASNFAMILSLLETEKDPDEVLQFVKMLRTASNNLDDTVKNLTQVVESSTKPRESLKPVKIEEMLEKAMGSLSAKINSTEAKITIETASDAEVIAIPAYVESIFHNLLSNAIKYHSPNRVPRIRIKVSATKEYRVISVEDNGRGLDLDKHGGSLFGMYNTFHGNKDARGIGLFITKNQIEAMGGSIEVESEPDKGSVFRVYLPK
jgi:PAS domain S-box-containing protein